ncbi:hypothetical protein DFH28DRAFT_1125521 [Melampsora americana]|nr:hypothetical protein DFH28DRAFT_1126066 [Melampsora americana]KAH9816100.1 hypothetical protein DFH28DRAFT_1125521 [Melampsora americana]
MGSNPNQEFQCSPNPIRFPPPPIRLPTFSPNQFDQLNYSPDNTSTTTNTTTTTADHQLFLSNTPESLINLTSNPTESSIESHPSSHLTNEPSINLPSPFHTEDQKQTRRSPKDTRCTYCQVLFTSRGVKLHEQRCLRKREADATHLQELAVSDLQAHATADREIYEKVVRNLSDELESTRRMLESTTQCLERSRTDHRISLEYADVTARSLAASREEVAQLRHVLEAETRHKKRPVEFNGENSRKLQRSVDEFDYSLFQSSLFKCCVVLLNPQSLFLQRNRGSFNDNLENIDQNRIPDNNTPVNRLGDFEKD